MGGYTLARIIEVIQDETGAKEVGIDTKLETLITDSLEFVALIQALSSQFGNISDTDILGLVTIGDVLKLYEGRNGHHAS